MWWIVCQVIALTTDDLLWITSMGTNFNQFSIKLLTFSFQNMHLKMLSAKWWPFCSILIGLNHLSLDQDGDKIADNIRSFFYLHSYSEIMSWINNYIRYHIKDKTKPLLALMLNYFEWNVKMIFKFVLLRLLIFCPVYTELKDKAAQGLKQLASQSLLSTQCFIINW